MRRMKRIREGISYKSSIVIEIDSLPYDLNPLKSHDYTSRFICSAMYEPLEQNKNCIIHNKDNLCYTIRLNPNYLGNAQQIINCFKYHLNIKNKSIYLKQL